MNYYDEFNKRIKLQSKNKKIKKYARLFFEASCILKYSYNFTWLGRPIIQYPQDIFALQEIIWKIKPDLIIETGIAHGGSVIFNASLLSLLDTCDAIEHKNITKRKVVAIDIDIRSHNLKLIKEHPLSKYIQLIEGSSIEENIVKKVKHISKDFKKVLVCLDSNHTYEHVIKELEFYADLVSVDSYCIVYDTVINDLPKSIFPNRPWGPKNNPKIAVKEYIKHNKHFIIDKEIENKLLITVAPSGYLKRAY